MIEGPKKILRYKITFMTLLRNFVEIFLEIMKQKSIYKNLSSVNNFSDLFYLSVIYLSITLKTIK